jgi:hypothetical protein
MPPEPEPKAKPEPMLARLAKALGLPEGATEDDALAMVARLVEALAKMNPALRKGHLSPAMKPWAVAPVSGGSPK